MQVHLLPVLLLPFPGYKLPFRLVSSLEFSELAQSVQQQAYEQFLPDEKHSQYIFKQRVFLQVQPPFLFFPLPFLYLHSSTFIFSLLKLLSSFSCPIYLISSLMPNPNEASSSYSSRLLTLTFSFVPFLGISLIEPMNSMELAIFDKDGKSLKFISSLLDYRWKLFLIVLFAREPFIIAV